MNRLLTYHLVTLIPMMVILYLYIYGVIGSGLFAILFCLYALVYRPIIDYKKLQEKGLVTGSLSADAVAAVAAGGGSFKCVCVCICQCVGHYIIIACVFL